MYFSCKSYSSLIVIVAKFPNRFFWMLLNVSIGNEIRLMIRIRVPLLSQTISKKSEAVLKLTRFLLDSSDERCRIHRAGIHAKSAIPLQIHSWVVASIKPEFSQSCQSLSKLFLHLLPSKTQGI